MLHLEKPAPDYSGTAVINGELKEISPLKYRKKYVVLLFYPTDFHSYPPTEVKEFSERAFEFRQIDSEVIGITCDTHLCHLDWSNRSAEDGGIGKVDFPLLADPTGSIARAYGVYNEETGEPYRALFIVDPESKLRHIVINDGNVPRDVDEILRVVQSLEFTDVHGQICPINWKPGRSTLRPSDLGLKHYMRINVI